MASLNYVYYNMLLGNAFRYLRYLPKIQGKQVNH